MGSDFSARLEKALYPLIFLAAFGFFLLGLDPSFYADDSPETITAEALLGIPHPPGYPLHTLLGHLFSLLPLGPASLRVNLFSAVLAASVCALLYGFLKNAFQIPTGLSAAFALLWAVGATTYPSALSAKTGIYHFTTLLLVAILWALWKKRLELAAFLLGLSFAHHWMTMVTFLPGLGILVYGQWKGEGIGKKRVYQGFSFFLAGLSVYLFLPIRALQNPWLNWGNPSTWYNFVFDFFRTQYLHAGSGSGLDTRLKQGWVYLQGAFLEFGGLWLAALWGIRKAYSEDKTRALGLAALWLGLVASVVFYLGVSDDQLYLVHNFVLPSQVFTLLFSAWGLKITLAKREGDWRGKAEKVLIGVLVAVLAGLGALRLSRDRQADYTYDYDYALNGFKSLPANALYFCKGDSIVFPCWYFQWVEQKRADVSVIGVDGLPMEWVRKNLAGFHPGLKVPRTSRPVGLESIPPMAQWIVAQNPYRELYFSFDELDAGFLAGVKMAPYGLTEKGYGAGQEAPWDEGKAEGIWQTLRLRHLNDPVFPVDERTQDLLVHDYAVFRNALGLCEEDLGDEAKAKVTPRSAAQDLLREEQDYQKSFENYQWAVTCDPHDALFEFNLGNACFNLGRPSDAMACFDKATRLNPRYTEAYFNEAVIALQSRDFAKARELFGKVLELDPTHAEARRGLDYLTQLGH